MRQSPSQVRGMPPLTLIRCLLSLAHLYRDDFGFVTPDSLCFRLASSHMYDLSKRQCVVYNNKSMANPSETRENFFFRIAKSSPERKQYQDDPSLVFSIATRGYGQRYIFLPQVCEQMRVSMGQMHLHAKEELVKPQTGKRQRGRPAALDRV